MRDKSEEFFPLVEKFYSSGLRAKAFCEQNGIKRSLLDYWKRRYRDKNKSKQVEKKGFVSVSVVEGKSERGLTIQYSDGTPDWRKRPLVTFTFEASASFDI